MIKGTSERGGTASRGRGRTHRKTAPRTPSEKRRRRGLIKREPRRKRLRRFGQQWAGAEARFLKAKRCSAGDASEVLGPPASDGRRGELGTVPGVSGSSVYPRPCSGTPPPTDQRRLRRGGNRALRRSLQGALGRVPMRARLRGAIDSLERWRGPQLANLDRALPDVASSRNAPNKSKTTEGKK